MCASSGLYAFPSLNTLNQNPVIILEGYGTSQSVIKKLNAKHSIYLQCGFKKIKLIVQETNEGEFKLTQAILKPAEQLQIGLVYVLHIDGLPEYESLSKWNNETQAHEQIAWKIVKRKDNVKSEWVNKPREIGKTLKHYGCGPERHVNFSYSVSDSSGCFIKAIVTNIKTRKTTSYFLNDWDNQNNTIEIGHGMCSGAFRLDGDTFEVSFILMDESGNITEWTGDKIKFTQPTKEEEQEFLPPSR